jgi:hypothetical protein
MSTSSYHMKADQLGASTGLRECYFKIPEDYNTRHMTIESHPDEIVLRVKLSDFDMGEMRAIQTKAKETGFIRVDELMKLQKAGYRRPLEVPAKPQPKDRSTLWERARQKMFVGEPRSI